jgi:hypothetical protein
MKIKLWTRKEVNSDLNLAETFVTLKSGKELSIEALVNEKDEKDEKAKAQMANEDDHVQVGEEKMTVAELKKKHQDMCNELTEMKAKHVGGGEAEGEALKKNSLALEEARASAKKLEDENVRLKNESDARKKADDAKAARDKIEADKLRNAPTTEELPTVTIELPMDKLARGKQRYG